MPVEQLLRDCREQRSRASGPGGQHRNKVETAIVIAHVPTGVTGAASERREQNRNRQAALQRLRVNLALTIRSDVADQSTPSALVKKFITARRLVIALTHADFPAVLAEVLDAVSAAQGDVAAVSSAFGVTTTQLVKFLKREPAAWARVCEWRQDAGLRPLK